MKTHDSSSFNRPKKLWRFISGPWPFIAVLAAIPVVSLFTRNSKSGATSEPKQFVEEVLVATAQQRAQFVEGKACDGSNFVSWSTQHRVKDFQVINVETSTKLNGEWVIPVVSEITDQKNQRRKVTFFLTSQSTGSLCVRYVKENT